MLLTKVVRQRGVGHEMEPEELHGRLPRAGTDFEGTALGAGLLDLVLEPERLGRERRVARAEQERVEPAALLDRAQRPRRDREADRAAQRVAAQRHLLEVRLEAPRRLAVRVRDVVAEGHMGAGERAVPSHRGVLAWRCRLLLGRLAVTLAEAVHAPVGVELAELARPERMAVGRDVEVDHGDLLAVDLARLLRGERRARQPLLARGAVHVEHLVVVGMDAFLHGPSVRRYQLDLRRPGSSPRCPSSRSWIREIANFRYTARERPVIRQRRGGRAGGEMGGSLADG